MLIYVQSGECPAYQPQSIGAENVCERQPAKKYERHFTHRDAYDGLHSPWPSQRGFQLPTLAKSHARSRCFMLLR